MYKRIQTYTGIDDSLVDGDFKRLQEYPLDAVVQEQTHEEGENEHDEHSPELATAPLREPHLRQQHATHVLHLLAALARQTPLVAEHLPTARTAQLPKYP